MNGQPTRKPTSILSVLGNHQQAATSVLLTGAVSVGLNVFGTLSVTRAIDSAIRDSSKFSSSFNLCAIACASYLTGGLMWRIQGRLTAKLIQDILLGLRTAAGKVVSGAELSELDRFGRAEIQSRLTNDLEGLGRSLQATLSQVTNSVLLALALISALTLISLPISAITLLTAVLSVGATRRISARSRPHYQQEFASMGRLNGAIFEWLQADLMTVRLLKGSERRHLLQGHADDACQSSIRAQRAGGLGQPASLLISYTGYCCVIVVGATKLRTGEITIGQFQAALIFSRQVVGPLVQLANLGNLIASGQAAWSRIREVSTIKTTFRQRAPLVSETQTPHILFRETTATRGDIMIIESVDFTLEAGSLTFLVGPTGAGKSTIALLVVGLIAPTEGSIETYLPANSPVTVSYVPQEAFLLEGKLGENLAGRDWTNRLNEIRSAVDTLSLSRFVSVTEEALSQHIPVGGEGLSLAERQAMSLLSAYLSDARLIVLDESTSALDLATEHAVFAAFRALSRDSVVLVLAHRMENLARSDRVLKISDRKVLCEQKGHE
jgi:ATP-binding cassette, subfamily B, multidrug efflux pump